MALKHWLWPFAAAGAATLAYAGLIERRWIQVRRPRVHVRTLPAQLEGLRIGLLSDLHAGPLTPIEFIMRVVRMLAREKPDLIAVTGDLSDDERHYFEDVAVVLASLRAPLGVYLVPGNHDYALGIGRWHAALRRYPSLVNLTNRSVVVDVDGARLCVAGVDDFNRGRPELRLPPRHERDFTLLLAHSPDQAERARRPEDAVDLIVSGHTHGGQIRLPWIGAPLRSADNVLYDQGLRRRPWTQVYTTRGIGTVHLPLRLLARPEITILRLTADPRPGRRGAALAPERDSPSQPTEGVGGVMTGKQMEGDNRQRRNKAKDARERGGKASEEGATFGASKQRMKDGGEEHRDKIEGIRRGKQRVIRENTPEPKPGYGE